MVREIGILLERMIRGRKTNQEVILIKITHRSQAWSYLPPSQGKENFFLMPKDHNVIEILSFAPFSLAFREVVGDLDSYPTSLPVIPKCCFELTVVLVPVSVFQYTSTHVSFYLYSNPAAKGMTGIICIWQVKRLRQR